MLYLKISEGDHIIPPFLQEQVNATTVSVNTSHAALVSQPDETAQLILNVTKGSKE